MCRSVYDTYTICVYVCIYVNTHPVTCYHGHMFCLFVCLYRPDEGRINGRKLAIKNHSEKRELRLLLSVLLVLTPIYIYNIIKTNATANEI